MCIRDRAYGDGDVGLHAPIRVRYGKEVDGKMEYRLINATVGRLIFNCLLYTSRASGSIDSFLATRSISGVTMPCFAASIWVL